jgi:hypothetical protein
VASVRIVIVGLDVADALIVVLELTLNDKIRVFGPRQINVIVAGASLRNETWKYSPPDSPTDT